MSRASRERYLEKHVRPKMCYSKNRYPDKRAAQSAMNQAMRFRGRHGRPEGLHAYPCPVCRGWHLAKDE